MQTTSGNTKRKGEREREREREGEYRHSPEL